MVGHNRPLALSGLVVSGLCPRRYIIQQQAESPLWLPALRPRGPGSQRLHGLLFVAVAISVPHAFLLLAYVRYIPVLDKYVFLSCPIMAASSVVMPLISCFAKHGVKCRCRHRCKRTDAPRRGASLGGPCGWQGHTADTAAGEQMPRGEKRALRGPSAGGWGTQ